MSAELLYSLRTRPVNLSLSVLNFVVILFVKKWQEYNIFRIFCNLILINIADWNGTLIFVTTWFQNIFAKLISRPGNLTITLGVVCKQSQCEQQSPQNWPLWDPTLSVACEWSSSNGHFLRIDSAREGLPLSYWIQGWFQVCAQPMRDVVTK